MVSGLVTSPCDQLRIFSGDARLMRMESNSAIALFRSNGLERYKVSSCGFYAAAAAPGSPYSLSVSTPAGMHSGVETGGFANAHAGLKPCTTLVSRPLRQPACGCPREF